MNLLGRILVVSLLVAVVNGTRAADADPGVSVRSIPGGVVDATGQIGFVAGANGGIDALDLETGKVLWTSWKAAKPIAVVGKKLIAWAPGKDVRIVVLDGAQEGKAILESDAVTLPRWVGAPGRAPWSRCSVFFDQNDLIYKYQLEAISFYQDHRGLGRWRTVPGTEAHCAARINLETGKVEMLADNKVPPDSPKLPKALENEKSEVCWIESDARRTPLNTGDGFAAVVADEQRTKLSLKRWDATGKKLETAELLKGKQLLWKLSTDGQHLCVHQDVAEDELPEGDYAWWVFSLETGKQVAKLPYTFDPIAVVGDRVFRETYLPRSISRDRLLSAYDLKSGKLVWKHGLE
jgi:outer membrane protein assembly factor BamB